MGHPRRHATARPIGPFGLGSASGQGLPEACRFWLGIGDPRGGATATATRHRWRRWHVGAAPASDCARSIAAYGHGVTRTGPLWPTHPAMRGWIHDVCIKFRLRSLPMQT